MKMKKLASIINPLSEEKSHQAPSLDDEGIGDKIAGFAKFASPKNGNKGARINVNGSVLVPSNTSGSVSVETHKLLEELEAVKDKMNTMENQKPKFSRLTLSMLSPLPLM